MTAEQLVSVLMPAYNCASFIGAAIESLLSQTYPHFELLVIDDGSTDRTAEIAAAYKERDPRVIIFSQPHCGIATSRNLGLLQAHGEFLACLDADDIALPPRLEMQVAKLRSNPELVIIGSAYQTIDEQGVPGPIHQMPATDTALRWHCLFHSPFAQSTVIMRLDVLHARKLFYDTSMPSAEDFELWTRLLHYGRGINLSEPLVQYRRHYSQVSEASQPGLRDLAGRVAQNNLTALGVSLPLEAVQQLRDWYFKFPTRLSGTDLPLAEALLNILNRFSLQPGLETVEVTRLRNRWLGRLLRAAWRGDKIKMIWLLRQLTADDMRAILAYLRVREKL